MAAEKRHSSSPFAFRNIFDNFGFYMRSPSITTIDLSPAAADALVRYQLAQTHPHYLGPEAFSVTEIVQAEALQSRLRHAESTSSRVRSTLLHTAILNPATDRSGKATGLPPVDTAKITKHLANKLYFVSAPTQKRIIALLFFWEEECARWRALEAEEKEIRAGLGQAGDGTTTAAAAVPAADLDMALQAVLLKKQLLPSERAEPTANVVTEGVRDELPAYAT